MSYFYPTPLEDLPKDDQLAVAMERMNEYINQNSREGGIRQNLPLEGDSALTRMQRIAYCRACWNGTLDDARYEYLYNKVNKRVFNEQRGIEEIITMELPARVRHIPIVQPKLRALVSKQQARPLVMKVMGVSHDIIEKKLDRIKDDVLRKALDKIMQKQKAVQAQQLLIQQQQQLIQQLQQQPELQMLIMEMQSEIEYLSTVVNKDAMLNAEDMKAIKQYYNYNHKEFEEHICYKALEEFLDTMSFRNLSNDVFEEQMISGEPIWYCHWEPGMERPELRHVRPEFIWYQYNETSKFLGELDWIVEYMPMSIGQVISNHGHELDHDDLEKIRQFNPQFTQDAYFRTNLSTFPNGVAANNYLQNQNYLYSHEVDVFKVYWKEQVEVYALYSENDNKTLYHSTKPPFIRFLEPDEYKKLTDTKEKREKLKKKGQKVLKAYRVDLWQGMRIGSRDYGVYFNIKKVDFQYREEGKMSDVMLPYIGFANNRFHAAYSPIWETKDLQELYNILHYQEELLIALSGVKGLIYDLSQAPEDMTPQELLYYMKQGLALIESTDARGKQKSHFNQFSTYDMTVSPAIATVTQIKQTISDLVGEITGVTRAQTGQIAATDQVGTTEIALQQSNVVTEFYFQKDDELMEQVFTRLCNIFPYAYAEGRTGAYIIGKERQEILNLQKGVLKGKFRSVVNSGSKEREIMTTAKQMAFQKYKEGQVSASGLLEILDIETMNEMKTKLKEYEDLAHQKQMEIQSAQSEQAKQIQTELKQMDMQMQQTLLDMQGRIDMQLQQIKSQVELQKEQVKMQVKEQEMQSKQQIEQDKGRIDLEKAGLEAQVEREYLQFQWTELEVNAATQRAQLLINKAKTQLDIHKSKNKERVKD